MTPGGQALGAEDRLDAFAYHAAHHLGEAVALLTSGVTVLQTRSELLGSGSRDALRAVAAGAERAKRFVDDLLDLALVTREAPQIDDVDLLATIDAARHELADALEAGGARVRAKDAVTLRMDRRHARALVVHLVRLGLAAGASEIRMTCTVGPDVAVLEVVDDGEPGAADGDPGFFEPFMGERGRGPLVGAGVSATICQRVAERHGGSASVRRRGGRTAVRVSLPSET